MGFFSFLGLDSFVQPHDAETHSCGSVIKGSSLFIAEELSSVDKPLCVHALPGSMHLGCFQLLALKLIGT